MSYYLKKFWKSNLLVIICQIFSHIARASLSLITIQMTAALIAMDASRSFFLMLILFLDWCVYLLLESLETMLRGRAVRKMNNAIRRDMGVSLLQKNYQSYHGQDKGEYLSWFTSGVNEIEQNAWGSFFSLASYIAQVAANVVVLSSLHWSFLLVAAITGILMIITPKLFDKKMIQMGESCAEGQAAAVSRLKDLLGGYDVLCFFDQKSRFSNGISEASEEMEKPAYDRTAKTGFIYGGIGVVNIFTQIAAQAYAALLAFTGIISLPVVFGSGQPCADVANAMKNIAYYCLCFSTAKPYFARITVHDDGTQSRPAQGTDPVERDITVEDVSFRYGEKPVLVHMNARFKRGGKYALTGPSGCGKSTLLKLILGWLPDYQGAIRFDGKDARSFAPEQLQRQMSYIAQDVFLFNTTIRDNITLGENFTDEQMEQAVRDSALAGDLVNMPLGLDTPVGEEGSSLSGGQRQRVAIARALIHDRSILLVDEGTSALDQKNASIVEESLLANPDLTLLLVSHHLSPERQAQFDGVYCMETAARG